MPTFDELFQTALDSTDQAYVDARTEILELGATALPQLEARRGRDWRSDLVSEAITGWLGNAERFQQCALLVWGNLPPPVPLGGFTTKDRAAAVVELGPSVTPALLEMLFKTSERKDDAARSTIFLSLSGLGDPRAAQPLLELTSREYELDWRRSAVGALGRLGEPRAVQPMVTILRDPTEDETLRSAAATALGTLRAQVALPDLRDTLSRNETPVETRKAIVFAIGQFEDRESAPTLVRLLRRDTDEILLLITLETVGQLGDRNALSPLQNLSDHPSEEVRDAAEAAAEQILSR